jgi:hypothetical protein
MVAWRWLVKASVVLIIQKVNMETNEDYTVDPSWLEGTVKELDKIVKEQEKRHAVAVLLIFANTKLNYTCIVTDYGPIPLTIEGLKNYYKAETGCIDVSVMPLGPRK